MKKDRAAFAQTLRARSAAAADEAGFSRWPEDCLRKGRPSLFGCSRALFATLFSKAPPIYFERSSFLYFPPQLVARRADKKNRRPKLMGGGFFKRIPGAARAALPSLWGSAAVSSGIAPPSPIFRPTGRKAGKNRQAPRPSPPLELRLRQKRRSCPLFLWTSACGKQQ